MRRRRAVWPSLLLLTFYSHVEAERLPIRTYTPADGLAHSRVNRIVKDSRGLLWFCTGDGLSRFDGYTFNTFGVQHGLPHASVYDLVETRGGEYWIATGDGLVRFDPKGQPGRAALDGADPAAAPMFTVLVSDDQERRARTVRVVREGSNGTIWAGTNRGLYRVEDAIGGRRSLQPVDIGMPNDLPEQSGVYDVLEDHWGSLWITTVSGLYRRRQDGTSAHYGVRDGLPAEDLSDLFEDHNGRLWVGTRQRGVFRLRTDDSDRPPVVDLTLSVGDGLPHAWVTQLFESSDRRFWIGTAAGLAELVWPSEETAPRFRSYSVRNGLSHRYVAGLTEDLGGNLWLSTHAAGAMKLTRAGFTTFGESDGIESVNALFEDRAGNLCFRGVVLGEALAGDYANEPRGVRDLIRANSHNRFGCFDGQRFHLIAPEAVGDWGWVLERVTLQARSGEWWLGHVGLYRFPPAERLAAIQTARPLALYGVDHGLAAPQVFRLFEDSRENIWVATTSEFTYGLARWEPRSGRLRDLAGAAGLPSLLDDLPHSFAEDASGRIWIGFNGGLARYVDDRFQFFTARDGLPAGTILDIHLDRSGRLWLASRNGGLVRVDDAGAPRPTFVRYTTAEGLSSDNIEAIVEDAAGHLYVGGGNGLDRFEPATGRVKHFGVADGLPPGILKAAFRDRRGVLWFGMSNGLARFVPAVDRPSVPSPVLITGVRVSGVSRQVSALGEQRMSLAALSPRDNQVQIDFVALRFGSGEVLRYQYRLEGADDEWTALAEQRSVTYASLAPGRYIFTVRAVNSDGLASEQPAALAFRILRPIWQRWWFVTLTALGLGLAIYAGYRYRVARLLEIANMRTHIATDLHDDIGANLTRIALLSEVASQTHGQAPLAAIARIARESVSSMSDIVWAINPKRESLRDLTRRMRQHAEEIFTLRDVELRFSAPAAGDGLKLEVGVRRDVLLIFKEAASNAARHSGCSAVAIDLRVTGSRLALSVTDNGSGFDASVERDGQGLTSMQRRANRLGAMLDVKTAPGSGTTVTLDAPI